MKMRNGVLEHTSARVNGICDLCWREYSLHGKLYNESSDSYT